MPCARKACVATWRAGDSTVAQKLVQVQICDPCAEEGKDDVPGTAMDVMIDDVAGTIDVCTAHREEYEEKRLIVAKCGRPLPPDRLRGHKLPKSGELTVRCGLCGAMVGVSARVSHARKAHGRAAGSIDWEGDLPFKCPAPECTYGSASPQGRAQHVRYGHPELRKPHKDHEDRS